MVHKEVELSPFNAPSLGLLYLQDVFLNKKTAIASARLLSALKYTTKAQEASIAAIALHSR